MQSKINRSNSDFSFIKKAYDRWNYPLWKVYSRKNHKTQYNSIIHKNRWNDFAHKTDKSVDLWRNDVFYSKSMYRIAREYLLRENYIWLNTAKFRIGFAGNWSIVSINMLEIVRNVWYFDRFRTVEALFVIEGSAPTKSFSTKSFGKMKELGVFCFRKL